MPLDFFAIERGATIPELPIRVTAEDVRAYLEATGEATPQCAALWAETVPPLALGAFVFAALLEQMPLPRTLHTGQEFDFIRPVAVGEELTARVTVAHRAERRGAMLTTLMLELRAGDEPVVTGRTTLVSPAEEREA